jgi:hypothetical protein
MSKMECGDVLHHVRGLGALIDRQPGLGDVPVGHHRARFKRNAGVSSEDEIRLDDLVGVCERLIDRAGVEVTLEGKVVAERGMDHGGLPIERGAHIGHRIQLLVFNRDGFRGILGDGPAFRHDGGDGLALPADMVDRNCMLGCGFETLQMREHTDPGRDHIRQLLAGHNGDDARQALCGTGIDRDDLRVGMGRAQEHHMRHPRQLDIADIEPAPLHQPFKVGPRHRLADIGIRPVQRGETRGIFQCIRHGLAPTRRRAVVSTASMMA